MGDQEKAMTRLHAFLAERLVCIEGDLASRGLGAMTRLTLIARDPSNDDMLICVSNEPTSPELRRACEVALKHEKPTPLTLDSLALATLDL